MEDNGSFNDLGFYAVYRLVMQSGLDALVQPPDMKEPETYDWGDENGVEVYLEKRFVKPRTIPLGFLLIADNEADFWLRYRNLRKALTAPGLIRLYINEVQRSFFVYYNRASNAKAVTLFSEGGKVCASLTLEFVEPKPSFEPYTFLTNIHGDYITTKQGNRILITT